MEVSDVFSSRVFNADIQQILTIWGLLSGVFWVPGGVFNILAIQNTFLAYFN